MSAVIKEPGLHAHERAAFIAAIQSSLEIETPAQFLQWTRKELQALFPHEILVCGVGQIHKESIQIRHTLNWNFPTGHLQGIGQPDGGVMSPIMDKWCRERKPQLFEPDGAKMEPCPTWLSLFHQYQLHNIAAHGMRDLGGKAASYFNFFRIPGKLTPHHACLLDLLVPHMHVALVRALENCKPAPQKKATAKQVLSAREIAILQWMQEGKTNWEIAAIERRSALTVKNQVRSILVKLRVNNRAQAVAKAISLKMIRARS